MEDLVQTKMKGILTSIRDLNTQLLEAGVEDTDNLIRAIRRMVIKGFVDEEITLILSQEE